MDMAGAAAAIAQLKGAAKRLDEQDNEVAVLVAFVCEALCEIKPELRAPLIRLAEERLHDEFPETWELRQPTHDRSKKLHYGLREIVRRLSA